MTGEEIAQKRYLVRDAKDAEKIEAGTTINVIVQVPISLKRDIIFSENCFKQEFENLIKCYVEEICYERDS